MAYTLRQLIDMIRTVPDARTALQKMNDRVESLDSANYGDIVNYSVGTYGEKIPLLSTANAWSMRQTFNGGISGELTGNASTATRLQTTRTFTYTGDVTGSLSFNGSANASTALTLANSGATAGTYSKVTIDAKGRVTSGSNLLASDVPTLNQNTTGNSGTATKLQTARTISIAGDATGSATFDGSANASISVSSSRFVRSYTTLANANENIANISVGQFVQLPDGLYEKLSDTATTLTKSAYDPLTQAKADATTKANTAEANAKTYTDSKLPVINPLINPVNNVQDLYVSVTTGSIFAETGSVINVFPVVGGQVHAVKSPSYDQFSFSIATRTTNSVATGATQGKVTLTDTIDPSIKLFTPPADAKYAFITVKKGVNFDISSTVKANIGAKILTTPVVKKANGVDIYDEQARIDLVNKSELLNAQLYDPKNTFDGKYSRYDTGAIASAADYMMNVFPVAGGKTYIINSSSYHANFFSLSTRDTASVEVGATQGKVTLVDTTNPSIKLFTVPETAKYAFITVKAGAGFDIRTGLQINEGTEIITSEGISRINGKSLYDIDLRKRVVVLEKDVANITSPLKNKKWGAYGDSITVASGCYAEILAARHSATLVKKAISGAKLHRNPSATEVIMSEVWDTDYALPYEPDLITIAIGTNDYMGYNTLGVMSDRDSTTFYGALHLMVGGLRTKYANARIGFISQIPRDGIRISPTGTDPESLKQKAVKEVCEYYSIPLFESYAKFGFNPSDNSTMRTAMMPDGLHPNSAGHAWYANRVEDFILSLTK